MKIAIYVPGLAQAFSQETVSKYAARFMREADLNCEDASVKFEMKEERESYGTDKKQETGVVTIFKTQNGKTVPFYRFYEFNYGPLLTSTFSNSNVFYKSALLLWLVISKLPIVVTRIFKTEKGHSYSGKFRGISFYALLLMLVMSLFGISLIPSALAVLKEVIGDGIVDLNLGGLSFFGRMEAIGVNLVAISAVFYTLVPEAKNYLASISTEFVCTHYYLYMGQQMQRVQGELDALLEHIAEKEGAGAKIHFHAYSFGCVIVFDHIFPISNAVSRRTEQMLETVISIGYPYDFVYAYYPRFYRNRNPQLTEKFSWFNVYSTADALGTNFRNDNTSDTPIYGIRGLKHFPNNIRYEISNANPYNVFNFLLLYTLKAHQDYWDGAAAGQSCLRLVVQRMYAEKMIELDSVEV